MAAIGHQDAQGAWALALFEEAKEDRLTWPAEEMDLERPKNSLPVSTRRLARSQAYHSGAMWQDKKQQALKLK